MEVKPGYKLTEVGVIPEDWKCDYLSAFISLISYGFTNPMPTTSEGIYMITAADINNGRLQLNTARKTSQFAYNTFLSNKSKPRENDILLTKDGTLGRLALVGEGITICINQSVAVIRPNERVESPFLKLLLEASYYQKKMIEDAGGSTIKHIYITIVDKMCIGLPVNKTEQKAITIALRDIDTLIDSLDILIAKKRDIKQAAMQELLTGKRRLPGFSDEWIVTRLGDIAHIQTGKRNGDEKTENGKYPLFVRSQIVESIDTYSYDCEAILIPGEGGIGNIIHYYKGRFDVHQRVYAITQFSSDISAKFIFFYMTQHFGIYAMKNSVKAAVDSLRLSAFTDFKLIIPKSFFEQNAIASTISDMDEEISTLEQRLEKTKLLKQAMMQELLTGRIRIL
jgi:type I restriction enzyme S subunit